MLSLIISLLIALPSSSHSVAADTFQHSCRSYMPLVGNGTTTVELVEFVAGNKTVDLRYRDVTCGGPGKSAPVRQDLCRIALTVNTSNRSAIEMEAWFPRDWNGRFVATGNGGIGGCSYFTLRDQSRPSDSCLGIDYSALAYTTQHGFAAVGSNNGHNGTTGKAFFHNSDVVADFAGRS